MVEGRRTFEVVFPILKERQLIAEIASGLFPTSEYRSLK